MRICNNSTIPYHQLLFILSDCNKTNINGVAKTYNELVKSLICDEFEETSLTYFHNLFNIAKVPVLRPLPPP